VCLIILYIVNIDGEKVNGMDECKNELKRRRKPRRQGTEKT